MKHGGYKTRLYGIWEGMRARCNQDKPKHSQYYGKGIQVCDEWEDFEVFREWALHNGYTDCLSIDRIDSNGNYSPENCRWVTQKEQCNNTTKNTFLTYKGKTQTVSQWAEELGIKRNTLLARIATGKSEEYVFSPGKKLSDKKRGVADKLRHAWRGLIFKTTSDKSANRDKFKSLPCAVEEKWKEFEIFKEWAYKNGYEEGKVLSRIDRSLGFTETNSVWMSKEDFIRSKAPKLIHNGEELTAGEWAKKLGMSKMGFSIRVRSGMTGDVLFRPKDNEST